MTRRGTVMAAFFVLYARVQLVQAASNEISVVELGAGRVQHVLSSLRGVSSLSLTTDATAGTVAVQLVVPHVAWIAVGVSTTGQMPHSIAVVGLPEERGNHHGVRKWRLGATRTPNDVQQAPDDQQTLTDTAIQQNETHTTLRFTKLLVEPNEPTVTLEGNTHFLYAIGRDNVWGGHRLSHDVVLNFAVVERGFESSGSTSSASTSGSTSSTNAAPMSRRAVWQSHGLVMALAWAMLVPLGIGMSVLKHSTPHLGGAESNWLTWHRALNGLAVALTAVGVVVAIRGVNQEGGRHLASTHPKVGLAIVILAVLQVLSGVFRPKEPHRETDTSSETTDAMVAPKSMARVVFEYQHRILGTLTLVLAWYNSHTGIQAFHSRFSDGARVEGLLWTVIVVLVAGVALRAVCQRRATPQATTDTNPIQCPDIS